MKYHPWKFFFVRNQTAQNLITWKSRIQVACCFEDLGIVTLQFRAILENQKLQEVHTPLCSGNIFEQINDPLETWKTQSLFLGEMFVKHLNVSDCN